MSEPDEVNEPAPTVPDGPAARGGEVDERMPDDTAVLGLDTDAVVIRTGAVCRACHNPTAGGVCPACGNTTESA